MKSREMFSLRTFFPVGICWEKHMVGWHDGGKSEMDAARKLIHPITCHTFISKCVHPFPDSFQRTF